MKNGTIIGYNQERQIGTIYVADVVGTRFFFFATRIISGLPSVGAKVIFEVSGKQVKPGQLPAAKNIIVLPPETDSYEKAVSYATAFDLKRRGIDPLSEGVSPTQKASGKAGA